MNEQNEAVKVKFCEKSVENGVAKFTFGNGTVLTLDPADLSADIQEDLMFHGALQKIGDSYAGAKGNYDEAVASARSVIEQLLAGEWKAARAAGEAKPRGTELASAIAQIKGIELAAAVAAVEAMSDEQRKAVRNHPKIKVVIAELRAAKLRKAADEASDLAL